MRETSDCREVPTTGLVVWRSAMLTSGAQSVTTFGALLMPLWFAGSWDSLPMVSYIHTMMMMMMMIDDDDVWCVLQVLLL